MNKPPWAPRTGWGGQKMWESDYYGEHTNWPDRQRAMVAAWEKFTGTVYDPNQKVAYWDGGDHDYTLFPGGWVLCCAYDGYVIYHKPQ